MIDESKDRRGGDRWKTRGKAGTCYRMHVTPRRALFTRFRVSKGRGRYVKIDHIRFSRGITESGKTFSFHDNWNNASRAHALLDEAWFGCSVFVEKDTALLNEFHDDKANAKAEHHDMKNFR